jgi:superfamily I DNA and/or RNA helicase
VLRIDLSPFFHNIPKGFPLFAIHRLFQKRAPINKWDNPLLYKHGTTKICEMASAEKEA